MVLRSTYHIPSPKINIVIIGGGTISILTFEHTSQVVTHTLPCHESVEVSMYERHLSRVIALAFLVVPACTEGTQQRPFQ